MTKNYILGMVISLLTAGIAVAQPPQAANPAAGNAANCTTTGVGGVALDVCPAGVGTFISNFQGGTYNRGNSGNHLGLGAIWRFSNVGTTGTGTINAEVTVNSLFQAVLDNMDDNSAADQNNVSVADFFGPKISPDQNLNQTDRRGYIQFTINFFVGAGNFSTPATVTGLNFISYDADGSFETGFATSQAWFRETRVAQLYSPGNPTVLASGSSELVSYNYNDPAATTWNGYAGSVYERDGISRCAQTASSFRYNSLGRSSITFRFGYDFKAGTNGYNIGSPSRQYGARFGCYTFPGQITLPVKLLSFNGAYRNQRTTLNWSTENEENFDHFEIERSTTGSDFATIGSKVAAGGSSRAQYELVDDLTGISGNVLYYRLKIVDKDGKFTYSQVVLIKKDSKAITGITINPNPVTGGVATVKMTSAARGTVELRVVDLSGRIVIRQTQSVYEGNNAITLNVERLQAGIYTVQVADAEALVATKFSVVR